MQRPLAKMFPGDETLGYASTWTPPLTNRSPAGGSAARIRVLCVTPIGPEGKGGVDRLYCYLRDAGRLAGADGVAIRYFASRGSGSGWRWAAAFPFKILRFAVILATWRPEIVHVNFSTGGSLVRKRLLAGVARVLRRPTIIHFHGQFPLDDIAAGTSQGRRFLALCQLADRVIALGGVSRGRFIAQANVPPERIRIVPNGIVDFAGDLALPKASARVGVLFAGQVGERKGVSVLIAALSILPSDAAWTCTIAGDGDIARYQALARRAGIGDRVRFTGWASLDEVHRLMREADIVLLPSAAENMPLSLIEGTCAGAALIATPVAETRAILRDGENGLIVSRDPEAIAAALVTLIADRSRLREMQVASRALYEANFTVDLLADRLVSIYREVARP